jgi:hypothetical protein
VLLDGEVGGVLAGWEASFLVGQEARIITRLRL